MDSPILDVRNLSVTYRSGNTTHRAVSNISFQLAASDSLGIVGESGSGKTTLARAIMHLTGGNCRIEADAISYRGRDLCPLSEKAMREIRGDSIGMIMQNPIQCLDPLMTVGAQFSEIIQLHTPGLSRAERRETAAALLADVGIVNPERVLASYPFELSGGMIQRITISMAMYLTPDLLICDEPTTALDVTTQQQIMNLLKQEKRSRNLSMLFISHNFGLIAEICNRVCVMYGGRIVESGSVDQIFYHPGHPYTQALLKSIPQIEEGNDKRLPTIDGGAPQAIPASECCPFCPRCPQAEERCKQAFPAETLMEQDHSVFCWQYHQQEGRL